MSIRVYANEFYWVTDIIPSNEELLEDLENEYQLRALENGVSLSDEDLDELMREVEFSIEGVL